VLIRRGYYAASGQNLTLGTRWLLAGSNSNQTLFECSA